MCSSRTIYLTTERTTMSNKRTTLKPQSMKELLDFVNSNPQFRDVSKIVYAMNADIANMLPAHELRSLSEKWHKQHMPWLSSDPTFICHKVWKNYINYRVQNLFGSAFLTRTSSVNKDVVIYEGGDPTYDELYAKYSNPEDTTDNILFPKTSEEFLQVALSTGTEWFSDILRTANPAETLSYDYVVRGSRYAVSNIWFYYNLHWILDEPCLKVTYLDTPKTVKFSVHGVNCEVNYYVFEDAGLVDKLNSLINK